MALPLAVRNRLAELILGAFEDREARQTLRSLATFCGAGHVVGEEDSVRLLGLGWFGRRPDGGLRLLGAYRHLERSLCSRVGAGLRALDSPAGLPPGPGMASALDRAARLAAAGLFFEVHELLEPVWLRAEGAERSALQGLIQVAVAFHHVENANARGAASLLEVGLSKLRVAEGSVPLDLVPWMARLGAMVGPLREGRLPVAAPEWPRPFHAPRPGWST